MATVTKRLQVRASSELLADGSNGGKIFLSKDVFIFCHRYTVADGDYAVTNQLVIEFDGAQEVLFCSTIELVAASAAIAHSNPAAISGSGRQGLTITTVATNGSSVAVELFAIVRV